MSSTTSASIPASGYNRDSCQIGVVHLGFGAFHRAHQAVYFDEYMERTQDLRWGIAAVNLRASESQAFEDAAQDNQRHDGYYIKSISAGGEVAMRRVRSHLQFSDWTVNSGESEALLTLPGVHMVSITVTESGYYTDPHGKLNLKDPLIAAEISGESAESVYAYLSAALSRRVETTGAPLTIACCDNIRRNGDMLKDNFLAYLRACNRSELVQWVEDNVAFPCSMVDRITPRSPASLNEEMSALIGKPVTAAIMAEDFSQWVLQSIAAADMPDLGKAGVIVTDDVDPYEETKIRVLNGGHTSLAYMAALEGIETFDGAMRVPHLLEHFWRFETEEVLPAITIELPFSKSDYLDKIKQRFSNTAIADTVARICADGMVKFPIFIRPTLEGCLSQGIMPNNAIRSIASWYVFAQHVDAGNVPFKYVEPSWNELKAMLGTPEFVVNRQLWGELPNNYPEFAETLQQAIVEMESKWPV